MEDPEKLEREEDMPELEKNDTLAMWIAGVLTVGIPIALVLIGRANPGPWDNLTEKRRFLRESPFFISHFLEQRWRKRAAEPEKPGRSGKNGRKRF